MDKTNTQSNQEQCIVLDYAKVQNSVLFTHDFLMDKHALTTEHTVLWAVAL